MAKVKNLSNSSNVKPILKELETIAGMGYSAWSVFDDWISLMFWALQRNDEEYLKVVHKYKNTKPMGEREIDHFCKAFSILVTEMTESNRELLGELYMEWEISSKYAGQFFTPWTVATFMAQITAPKGKICDPSSGSGVMLIAASKAMTAEDLDEALFVGQDIDFTCVKMTAINLTLFSCNGYAIWGDSLVGEKKRMFRSMRGYPGVSLMEVPVEELKIEIPTPDISPVPVISALDLEPANSALPMPKEQLRLLF